MMRKVCVILILVFTLLLGACNKTEQGSSVEHSDASVTIEPKSSKDNTINTSDVNKQSSNTKSTTTKESNDDINTSIVTLKKELKGINDMNLGHDERVEMTTRFIKNLNKYLQTKESTKLSDEDLQKELDYSIVTNLYSHNIDGVNVRIVRFDGSSELFGTLERRWTYIQWWNDKEINSQIVIQKGAAVTDDFLFLKCKEIPTIFLAGYQTIYQPYPVFISTWQLKEGVWEEANLFSDNIKSGDNWNINVNENVMLIKSNNKDDLTVELNQLKDGFDIFSDVDQNEKLELKLKGEQIEIQ